MIALVSSNAALNSSLTRTIVSLNVEMTLIGSTATVLAFNPAAATALGMANMSSTLPNASLILSIGSENTSPTDPTSSSMSSASSLNLGIIFSLTSTIMSSIAFSTSLPAPGRSFCSVSLPLRSRKPSMSSFTPKSNSTPSMPKSSLGANESTSRNSLPLLFASSMPRSLNEVMSSTNALARLTSVVALRAALQSLKSCWLSVVTAFLTASFLSSAIASASASILVSAFAALPSPSPSPSASASASASGSASSSASASASGSSSASASASPSPSPSPSPPPPNMLMLMLLLLLLPLPLPLALRLRLASGIFALRFLRDSSRSTLILASRAALTAVDSLASAVPTDCSAANSALAELDCATASTPAGVQVISPSLEKTGASRLARKESAPPTPAGLTTTTSFISAPMAPRSSSSAALKVASAAGASAPSPTAS
mmetsp:Transcript_45227/g.134971  ORF Transcript_45227/g.134971 Transcript_45227/m.134971 type:complete len:432 (-) Transcript_45227:507-1802(-)